MATAGNSAPSYSRAAAYQSLGEGITAFSLMRAQNIRQQMILRIAEASAKRAIENSASAVALANQQDNFAVSIEASRIRRDYAMRRAAVHVSAGERGIAGGQTSDYLEQALTAASARDDLAIERSLRARRMQRQTELSSAIAAEHSRVNQIAAEPQNEMNWMSMAALGLNSLSAYQQSQQQAGMAQRQGAAQGAAQ